MDTDEQQLEAAKKWWKENGSAIVTGLVLGLATLFGFKYWQDWQANVAEQASIVYSGMLNDVEQGDAQGATDKAGTLIADFGKTPYASLAAMMLARYRIEDGNLEAAQSQLQWVVDNGNDKFLRDVARLRLARTQVASEAYDAALLTLAAMEAADNDAGLLLELRGDIELAQGKPAEALLTYSAALAGLDADAPAREVIQLKLDDAASQAGAPAAEAGE